MKYLQDLKSVILEGAFKDFLTKVNFYKEKVSLMFEFSGERSRKEVENFEKEVENLAKIAGFKEGDVSIITSNKGASVPKKPELKASSEPIMDLKVLKGVKKIICVASCKGGVGKSTIAINVAKDFAESGYKVGLLDADIYGPSIPIMLEIEGLKPEMIDGKFKPIEKEGVKVFSMGFLVKNEDALMWRGPVITKTIRSFFEGVEWGELDLLVVDLPPGTGDIYISLLTTYNVEGVLMVSSPHKVSMEELKKTISLFAKFKIKVLGVVENMIEGGIPEGMQVLREPLKKEGFVRTHLNFVEKLKLFS